MISTAHLTADQLDQLAALLADTTPGGGVYRPPVATDVDVLKDLEDVGLVRWTQDCGYEITDAGKAVVVDRAMDAADTEAFLRYATPHELRESIRRLKEVFPTLVEDELRERTLRDIEACQDVLDAKAEGQSESTGRHRLVPVDERPTAVLPRVQDQTVFEPSSGTLPGLPIVEPAADVLSPDYGETLLAAIKGEPVDDDVYDEFAAEQTAGWDALEADLGDTRSWWRRKLRPHRAVVLAVVVSVVVTWGIAWLVLG